MVHSFLLTEVGSVFLVQDIVRLAHSHPIPMLISPVLTVFKGILPIAKAFASNKHPIIHLFPAVRYSIVLPALNQGIIAVLARSLTVCTIIPALVKPLLLSSVSQRI